MVPRAASPTASENELDIADALIQDSVDSGDEAETQHPDRKARMLAKDSIPELEDSESDDAAFIADIQAAANRKATKSNGKILKKGGGFFQMGLNATLLKAIARKGFHVPTPIQRKTIPLILDGRDIVGMARTGSGKTAAFVIPMLERLKNHSAKVGTRALILSPSRELALQTLKVVKELSKGTDLRCALLVGGDDLNHQFGLMADNPDIVIATPGRFLHLKVEMGTALDLTSIRYAVFDEADRLFEQGFGAVLNEILHALPSSRQNLLFSATLPKSLVEFARAGLQEPTLVRLDAESKISPDLSSAFFTVKSAEKDGALLHILSDIIKVPTGLTEAAVRVSEEKSSNTKKRKRGEDGVKLHESPTKHSTVIFAATKHHVEYLASLLRRSGFTISIVYGSLDQVARRANIQNFRDGMANILIVTDVAARGIDIPVLANVVNYDFPAQPKIFVHRVGRTARAGQKGWSYSLVKTSDVPYLLDLQLFLGKRLIFGQQDCVEPNCVDDVVVGTLSRNRLEINCELVNKLFDEDTELVALKTVANKGEKLYVRTRNPASSESARRAKEVVSSKTWTALHSLFNDERNHAETQRESMLGRVSAFRPQESIFELGKRAGGGEAAEIMKKRRARLEAQKRRDHDSKEQRDSISALEYPSVTRYNIGSIAKDMPLDIDNAGMDSRSESELEVTISRNEGARESDALRDYKDPAYFMSYAPNTMSLAEDRGYGVHSGGNDNFVTQARSATMDLNNDDGARAFAEPSRPSGMRWDKKSKKYVARANDNDGSKGARMIKSESGLKIAATFRSGRFDSWRKTNKIGKLARTGEPERAMNSHGEDAAGKRWKHKQSKAPKEADKFRDDFHKRRKKVEKAKEERRGIYHQGKGKSELRGIEDVRKERSSKQGRKEKNARPRRKKA